MPRTSPLSSSVFHTASALSGSLRSPPSPRGEGFVSGIPLPPSNLRPFGAPPSKGRRENAAGIGLPFLAHRLRGVPLWGKEEECRLFASSFRAKARNLFRSRSGKVCEDSGERETPCSQRIGRTVFHADSITKENGNGKRKRSLGCARDDETRERLFPFLFNLLRKPTPPRCARQPLPREGARVATPEVVN